MLQKKVSFIEHDQTPIECLLCEVSPLKIIPIHLDETHDALNSYYYLGYKGSVGENMIDSRENVTARQ